MARPSPRRPRPENLPHWLVVVEMVVSLTHHAMTALTVLGSFYIVLRAVEALAGRTTLANIAINVLADVKFHYVVSTAIGVAGGVYGLAQREMRRRAVGRLQRRIFELEQGYDPKRSSSNLTPQGTTRKEDR